MSTCSPVTDRTTSGPVTKIRPASLMITMSVSAGPYAAPPAAGPSTTEICGTRPDALHHRGEHLPDGIQRDDALGEAGAAGVPQAQHRHAFAHGGVDRVDDVPASVGAHRAAHPQASVANAITGTPSMVRRAPEARRSRRAAASNVSVSGVEQCAQPDLRGAESLWGSTDTIATAPRRG